MKDILLKFDSKEQAITFAEDNGFTSVVEEDELRVIEQGEDYVFTVIGEHWTETGETETFRDEDGTEYEHPIMVSDDAWWVLFRDMADRDMTPAEDFIVWHSAMTELNEEGEEVSIPRPTNAPNRIFL
tara:strand:+ start:241 stop:624 length:384 start_codon:yes stop_codon:yes gene_type:complete